MDNLNKNIYFNQIKEACKFLKDRIPNLKADIAVVLGSGLQAFGDALLNPTSIPYIEIPGFPITTVKGHEGKLIFGETQKGTVIVMQGRAHLYEGWNAAEITFYVRVLQFLGIQNLIITNAAGALNENYSPGDFVILNDCINLTGRNPLIGDLHPMLGKKRFLDMSEPFDLRLKMMLESAIKKQGLPIRHGVYICSLGPTYESSAEAQYLRRIGGDLAGMSTVLEVIAAKHGGLHVAGVSLVTNMCCGNNINHNEVCEMGKKKAVQFINILQDFFLEYFEK